MWSHKMDTDCSKASSDDSPYQSALTKMEALKAVNLAFVHHVSEMCTQDSEVTRCGGPLLFGKTRHKIGGGLQGAIPEHSRLSDLAAKKELQQLVNQLKSTAELLQQEKKEHQDRAHALSLELMEARQDIDELTMENKRLTAEATAMEQLRKDVSAIQKQKEDAQGQTLVLCLKLDMAQLELEKLKAANSSLLKEIQEAREAEHSGMLQATSQGFEIDGLLQKSDQQKESRNGVLEVKEQLERDINLSGKVVTSNDLSMYKEQGQSEPMSGLLMDSDKRNEMSQETEEITQSIMHDPGVHNCAVKAETVQGDCHGFQTSEGQIQMPPLGIFTKEVADLTAKGTSLQSQLKEQQAKICLLTAEKRFIEKETNWLTDTVARLESENAVLILERDAARIELSMIKDDLDVLLESKCDADIYAQSLEGQLASARKELLQKRETRTQAA